MSAEKRFAKNTFEFAIPLGQRCCRRVVPCKIVKTTKKNQADLLSYFRFPKNKDLSKKLIFLCVRNDKFDHKTENLFRLRKQNDVLKSQLLALKFTHKRCKVSVRQELRKILGNILTPKQTERLLNKSKCKCGEKTDIAAAIALHSISRRKLAFLFLACRLQKWTRNVKCAPGVLQEVLTVLHAKSQTMTLSKLLLAVVSLDEMQIDGMYCYDQTADQIFRLCKNVQVIMARGRAYKWKQTICYDFDTKVTRDLLFHVIKKLEERGSSVIAVVSDMGGSNQGLCKSLSISVGNVSFRNFLDYGMQLRNGTVIRKEHISNMIGKELKLCPKLSDVHLNRQTQCKAEKQLFSHHTAMRLLVHYKSRPEIGQFLKQWINYLIAFGLVIDEQLRILRVMENETANMRILQHKCLIPLQKDVLVTINSLRELREFFNVRYSMKCILTSRLNQDVLEKYYRGKAAECGRDCSQLRHGVRSLPFPLVPSKPGQPPLSTSTLQTGPTSPFRLYPANRANLPFPLVPCKPGQPPLSTRTQQTGPTSPFHSYPANRANLPFPLAPSKPGQPPHP
ncbi:hypothetical protein PR048_011503 [Dryococelus australis]|uniref:Transposable element P transposase-like RNase H domain-containing protein n=1 Tax=Dryococelus australis TaxID=614101 RepID=A0ABQ9HMI2_9NEOP|nr:hypothetical protein PR048_011503 [Dryococelus australis]